MAQSALGGKEAEQAYKDFITELSNTSKPSVEKDELRDKLELVKNIKAIRVTPLKAEAPRQLKKVTKQ